MVSTKPEYQSKNLWCITVHFELKETHKYIYTLRQEKKHRWVGRVTKCCHTAELWDGQQRLPFAHIAEDFPFFSLALHIRLTYFNMYQFEEEKGKSSPKYSVKYYGLAGTEIPGHCQSC